MAKKKKEKKGGKYMKKKQGGKYDTRRIKRT